MDAVVAKIEEMNGVVNDFVWGPYMLAVFLVVGLMFTVRTGVFQVSRFKTVSYTHLDVYKRQIYL